MESMHLISLLGRRVRKDGPGKGRDFTGSNYCKANGTVYITGENNSSPRQYTLKGSSSKLSMG
jgi:hypothetical protein